MTIKDKLIHPYYIESGTNGEFKVVQQYKIQEGTNAGKIAEKTLSYHGNIPACLRKIEKFKQSDANVTISLDQYAKGIEQKIKAYDEILAKLELPDLTGITFKINELEKEIKILKNNLR